MWDFILVPGASLASSLEGAAHVTPISTHIPSGLETAPLPADLSSVGVIPLDSGAVVPPVTVSGLPDPPASPQDDLDVPLSKLVSDSVKDYVTEVPGETAKLSSSKPPVVDVSTPSAHVGEALPPSQKKPERREILVVLSKRRPHDSAHICLGLSEQLGARLHHPSLNIVSSCLQFDIFYRVCVLVQGGANHSDILE